MKTARPTTALKQKKVLKILGENGGNFRKAIKDAGYSQKYADNPSRLTNTKTWKELTPAVIPNDFLAAKLFSLLEKKQIITVKDKNGKVVFIDTDQIDGQAVAKGLDMAFKIKGYYNRKRV